MSRSITLTISLEKFFERYCMFKSKKNILKLYNASWKFCFVLVSSKWWFVFTPLKGFSVLGNTIQKFQHSNSAKLCMFQPWLRGKKYGLPVLKKILVYQSCGGCVSPGYQLAPSPHLFIQPLMQSAARIPQQTLKFEFPEMCSLHCAGWQILLNFVNERNSLGQNKFISKQINHQKISLGLPVHDIFLPE